MRRTIFAILGGAALGLILAIGLGCVLGVGLVVVGARTVPGPTVEPSQKATILAQSISEAMNCSAAAAIVLIPLGAIVVWRRTRRRDGR